MTLPDSEFSGKNLSDVPAILQVAQYGVFEWCPEKDGLGRPTALVIDMQIAGALDGLSVMLRLKCRERVDELIAMLERHRDNVWPPEGVPSDE